MITINDSPMDELTQHILRDTYRTIVDQVHVDLRVQVHGHMLAPIRHIVEDQIFDHSYHQLDEQMS
jgi:hypothetical protein